MPIASAQSSRIEVRVRPEDKILLSRAAAAQNLDLSGFILRGILPQAKAVLEEETKIRLSERDSLKVLDLLENPPPPNERLSNAAKAGKRLG